MELRSRFIEQSIFFIDNAYIIFSLLIKKLKILKFFKDILKQT